MMAVGPFAGIAYGFAQPSGPGGSDSDDQVRRWRTALLAADP
jgi:hypothetical protein